MHERTVKESTDHRKDAVIRLHKAGESNYAQSPAGGKGSHFKDDTTGLILSAPEVPAF